MTNPVTSIAPTVESIALAALKEISNMQPRPFEFPADWSEQIEACPECQSYKNHSIQNGICNTHRQPMYERERHDSFEKSAQGPRMRLLARDAIWECEKLSTPSPPSTSIEQTESAERDLATAVRKLGLEELVHGWHASGAFDRHPDELGCTLPTNCGTVYAIVSALSKDNRSL